MPLPEHTARDWPAPSDRYMCQCALCTLVYFGPKRSNICMLCKPPEPKEASHDAH